MLIFRVETDNGDGPCVSESPWSEPAFPRQLEMLKAHNDAGHPLPHEDNGIDRSPILGREFCGTLDLSDLLQWFDGFHQSLDAYGYQISVYDAPDMLIGDSGQVIFDRQTAIKVNRHRFSEVKDLVATC